MNEEVLKVITSNMVDISLDVGGVNQLLVSSLVKYLADKQLIDLDDYLKHNQETQEYLLQILDNEREKDLVEKIFAMHRKDFEKPE